MFVYVCSIFCGKKAAPKQPFTSLYHQDFVYFFGGSPHFPGTRMPPELVKRLGPTGPPAPPSGPSGPGGPVDPRMHWLEPWKGLDGNKYDKEDLKLAMFEYFFFRFSFV